MEKENPSLRVVAPVRVNGLPKKHRYLSRGVMYDIWMCIIRTSSTENHHPFLLKINTFSLNSKQGIQGPKMEYRISEQKNKYVLFVQTSIVSKDRKEDRLDDIEIKKGGKRETGKMPIVADVSTGYFVRQFSGYVGIFNFLTLVYFL